MSYETQYAAYQQGIEDYLAGLFACLLYTSRCV